MRISTTALLLTCTVLLCSAIEAFAAPGFDIVDVKHACGGNPGLNGAFKVHITSSTGLVRIRVIGGSGTEFDTNFVPLASIPNPFPIENLRGGEVYLVIVNDGSGFLNKNAIIDNFNVELGTVVQNTNPGCVTPNGSISVTLSGSGAGPIQYTWTGPGGPYMTQNISNLAGGDYSLSYTDGVSTCTLPPVHIDDPAPTAFTISTPSSAICDGNSIVVTVSTADTGWTYSVMEGASVLASAPGAGGSLPITVPAAMLAVGTHPLTVRASAGVCPPRFNDLPNLSIVVSPTPDYDDGMPAAVCSDVPLGIDLIAFKAGASVAATDFNIINVVSTDLVANGGGAPGIGSTITTSGLADDRWKNTVNGLRQAVYTLVPVTNGCPGLQFTVTVPITAQPDYNDYDNDLIPAGICSGSPVSVDLATLHIGSSVAATSFSATAASVPAGLTPVGGTPALGAAQVGNAMIISNNMWQNVTNASVDVVYTIVPTAGTCAGDPFTVIVTINPQPDYNDYNNNLVPGGICAVPLGIDLATLQGAASIAAASFNITNIVSTGLVPVAGTPTFPDPGVAANAIADDVWANTSSLPIDVVYTIVPVGPGNCAGDPFTVTVTIKSQPDYNDATPQFCSNDGPFSFNLDLMKAGTSITATSYEVTGIINGPSLVNISATPVTLGPLAGNTLSDTWENTTDLPRDVAYTIVPTGGGCAGEPFTVTITINPEPVYTNYSNSNVPAGICTEDAVNVDLSTLIGPTSATATNFSATAASVPAGLTPVGGTPALGVAQIGDETIIADDMWSNTTGAAIDVVYTVIASTAAGCESKPFTVTVTINPLPVYTNYDNNLSPGGICATPLGIDLSTLKGASSIAATTFNITDIVSTGLVAAAGSPTHPDLGVGTGAIADDVWSNTTAAPIDVIYTIVPVGPGGCEGAPFTVKVTIKPQPDYNDFIPMVCSNDGAFTFNLDLMKAPASITADRYDVITIVADPGLTNLSATPVTFGTLAGSSLIDTWENTTSGPLAVEYTIVPTAGTCAGASFKVTVTINPEPVYTNYNNSNTPGGICSEDAVNVDLSTLRAATSVVAASFTATASSVPAGLLPAGATPALGAAQTGNAMIIADDMWTNTSNTTLDVVYTVVAASASGCDSKTFTVTVTINPQPDYDNYNNNLVPNLCSGTALGIDLAILKKSTSVAATLFNITNIVSTGLTGTAVPVNDVPSTEISDDVWKNVTALPHDVVYTIVPRTAGNCAGEPFTVTVTILPEPDYNSYNNDAAPGGICSRAAVGLDLLTLKKAASIAATSYEITTAPAAGLLPVGAGLPNAAGPSPAGAIADDQWQNITSGPLDVAYTIVPTTGTCVGASFTVIVTIKPEPLSANVSKEICDNTAVAFNLQTGAIDAVGNALPATSFSWTVAANANVGGETSSSGVTINDILDNTTSADESVVYTVTPTTAGCQGAPFTVTIIVHPTPVVAAGQTVQACSGTPVGYSIQMNPANLPLGTTFSWPDPDGFLLPGQPGSNVALGTPGTPHINDLLLNIFAAPATVNYQVTPHIGVCSGAMVVVAVVVNRAATVNAGPSVAICTDNGTFTLSGASRGGSSTNATWSMDAEPVPGAGTINPLTALTNPATATFTATTPGDYVLRLTTNDPPTVCGPVSDTRTITVTPIPVVAASQTKTICGNDPVAYEIQTDPANFPPNTVFNWPDPDGSGPAQAGVNIAMDVPGTLHINDVLINNSAGDITVTYDVTPSVGLCVGDPVQIVITVRPSPVVAIGQTKTICSGDLVDYEDLSNPANLPADTKFSWPDPDGAGPATSRLNVDAGAAGTLHIKDILYNGTAAPISVIYQVISLGINGCRGVTRDVTIIVNPGAIAEAGNAQAICSAGTATLTGSSVTIGGAPANGTWSIVTTPVGGGDGTITSGATPAAATFTASVAGDYGLQLTSDDPAGACNPVTDIVIITVKSPGDPSCTGGTGTCSTVSIIPIPTPAQCNNSDGSVFFSIIPPVPITGDVKITIDGTGPTSLPVPRTNFAATDGFTFNVLPTGTYSYVIEYGGPACTKTGVFAIDRSGTIGTPTVSNIIDPTCFGTPGTATINATGETGNVLQWSSDGITFTNFIAGAPITTLPAAGGLISIKRAGDLCAAGVNVAFNTPTQITAAVTASDATCNNNDGSLTLTAPTGGTGPHTFDLNGTAINIPASGIISGLTANSYVLTITDTKGCARTLAASTVAFPGFVNSTGPIVTPPTCNGGGTDGRVDLTITDPGSFQFAMTTDLITEPTSYSPLGGSQVSQLNLANGDYALWLKPQGAGVKCATKVLFNVAGVYGVSFAAATRDVVCFSEPSAITVSAFRGAPALPYSYTLIRTQNNSTTTGVITASQALGTFTINGVTPGQYLLQITQDQSALVPACTTPISGGGRTLTISGPTAALDSLYVIREISYPDLPSGSAVVGVKPSGLDPYEVRLELTDPALVGQEFVSDWSEPQVNPLNLKLEKNYSSLFAGQYTLGIRDAGGCERTYLFTIDVDTDLFIPNVFTPNGDGRNEVFYIRNLPDGSKLLVTNRWGKEVYKSSAYANDWNGGDAVDGLYYYTLNLGGQSYTGWIEILRGR